MAQLGIHGAVGLGVASRVKEDRVARPAGLLSTTEKTRAFKFTYVLGNILPDVDFFLLGPLYLVNSKIGGSMHRTFSHSLITVAALTLLIYLFSRSATRQAIAAGIGLGMLTHIVLDTIVWFSGVGLLWPLNYVGIPAQVNFWAAHQPPGWASNLLGALDAAAIALYFWQLLRTARSRGTDAAYQPRLAFWSWFLLVPSAVLTVLSFVLQRGIFNIVAYGFFIPFLLPLTLLVTFRMKETIYQA